MAEQTAPAENVFRVVDGKYVHNNEEISKEEFDKRKAAVDQAMGISRDVSGKRARPSMAERKAAAESEFKRGGKVSSASSRADGIAQRGKTKGRMV